LVHPGADHWTPVELSRTFLDRIAAPKRLVILANAGHYPVEEPGTASSLTFWTCSAPTSAPTSGL
jgi:alpha-beta hydrolase superfamily lysophospholipase